MTSEMTEEDKAYWASLIKAANAKIKRRKNTRGKTNCARYNICGSKKTCRGCMWFKEEA
jgi:hypothetical protein